MKRINTELRGLNLFNLTKYFDVIVGDSLNDILCGKNAACKTCLVSYTALDLNVLMKYKPDYVIDSLVDISDIYIKNRDK